DRAPGAASKAPASGARGRFHRPLLAADAPAKRRVALVAALAENGVVELPYRAFDRRPIVAIEDLPGKRKNLCFFDVHVAPERCDIRARWGLDVLARRDRAVDDVVERDDQRVAVALQCRVLFAEQLNRRSRSRVALRDPRKRQVLFGMV